MSEELYPMIAGETVTVRPIRKSDVDMERDFIRRLSPDSKHFRFLGGVSELPPDELKRLCDVDGNHTMAFVATVRRADRELEIGVSRYAQDSEADVREIAITVADEWQHKGLGLVLMRHLIEAAKAKGVRQLYSIDLASNTAMAALARGLGMKSLRDPSDSNQLIYSLTL
ncbi:MAG: GNAT family N-acetyltransferase [Steroidobacteraceae bacterium]|jgi:GNAT superfamily N-acetyltransferase